MIDGLDNYVKKEGEMNKFLKSLAAKAAGAKKALASAAAVLVTIEGFSGTPTTLRADAAALLAALAAFGVTYTVSNKA